MDFFVLNFQKFMLIFVRIIGIVMTAPFFGSGTISVRAKLGLTFFLSAVMFPLVYTYLPVIPDNMVEYSLVAGLEGMFGITLGFCLRISFSAYQLAGQFFTVQMGFGASEVFDPMSQISLPLMGQFLYLLAILVFLSMHGPLLIIKELFHSFEYINAASFLRESVVHPEYGVVALFGKMLLIALRIALPIVGTLLTVSVTMGLLAKAAPQMNLLLIGFPISITVGFIILILILPGLIVLFREYIDKIFENIWYLMLDLSND